MVAIILTVLGAFLLLLLTLILREEKAQKKENTPTIKSGKIWQGSERRQFVRIDAEMGVRYEVTTEKPMGSYEAKSKDISLGGINLVLPERLSKGTFIRMEIDLSNTEGPLFVKGESMWSKEIANSAEKFGRKLFATGIKFKRMDIRDQTALNKFIAKKLKAKPAS